MASLIKRPSSNFWYAQYYVTNENGELVKVRKSTRIEYVKRPDTGKPSKKERDALQLANDMEKAAQGAMPADASKAEQLKSIYAQLGQDIARETITSVSLRKCFTGMMRILTGEEMKIITIESWCKEWLERKARDSSTSLSTVHDSEANVRSPAILSLRP